MNKYKGFIILTLVIAVLYAISRLPLTDYLNHLTTWFKGMGAWGPIVYLVFFSLTSSWMFPVFMLSMGAGLLFGMVQGILIVSVGNLLSCLIMFFIARYSVREWFEKRLSKYKTVGQITKAIESEGWRILFMLRAVPIIHMIVLNIACGLSNVRIKDYILGTWLGMLPMLLAYVYMGSLSDSVIASPKGFGFSGAQNTIIIVVAVIALGGLSLYLKKVMKKHFVPTMA